VVKNPYDGQWYKYDD
jgi:hypothetical protein